MGGSGDGIQRWRLTDGQEVGKQQQPGMVVVAISVSRDRKWVVCGTWNGASVWDAELREKLIDVDSTNEVRAVDVSPDSTRFATGTTEKEASVWSISSGKRLVGPLKHDGQVTGVRFSPSGEHFATACYHDGSVRIFESHTGNEVINIKTITSSPGPNTPLVWSNNSQQILAASSGSTIKSFDVSTGSQLAESQILDDGEGNVNVKSIALATNGSFIATYSGRTIFFLDASTLTRIGAIINDSGDMTSIALSPDSKYIATGQYGKISVHDIGHILLDPLQVSTCRFIMSARQMCPILSPVLTHLLRHLLTSNDNRTSPAVKTNPTVKTSPAAKRAIVTSSKYPFVLFAVKPSSHNRIGRRAVEYSRSRV